MARNASQTAGLVKVRCPNPACKKILAVKTEMGGPNAIREIEESADTALWLATLPEDGPSGGFFKDREQLPW